MGSPLPPDPFERAALVPAQRALLAAFGASPLAKSFYLTGGTALAAFYLHHRDSDDLDFFTDGEVPGTEVGGFLAGGGGVTARSFPRLYHRRIFLLGVARAPLKVEFSRYPFPRSVPLAALDNGISV